jgi:hypothetical protein
MRRILSVSTAAMVMALLMTVAMALPVSAAPPQEGEVVGGGGETCTFDHATQTETCSGGGGGHVVGSQSGTGAGLHRVTTGDNVTSVSGGSAGGGADAETIHAGGRCVRNSEGTYDCVGENFP